MARRQKLITVPAETAEAFEGIAAELDERFKLPAARVCQALDRIAGVFVSSDAPEEEKNAARSNARWLLRDALSVLPARKALKLFEDEDVSVLLARMQNVDYLLGEFTPFYTIADLSNRLDAFLAYLGIHRDFLTRTGLPPEPFRQCRWLYTHLGRHYDTRTTGSPFPVSALFSNPQANEPPYRWLRSDPQKGPCDCEYEGADFLPRMRPADALRLEKIRGRFFKVKADTVDRIVKAARHGCGDRLWTDCLTVLTDELRADEFQFLLEMDQFYLRTKFEGEWNERTGVDWSPGGLTNLLLVLGHVEKELKIRTMALAKEALGDLARLTAGAVDSAHVTHRYLRLVGRSERRGIDRALDEMANRVMEEREFWEQFKTRAVDGCRRGFRVNIDLTVFAKYADRLAPFLREYAQELETRAERGESLLRLDRQEGGEAVFCWGDGGWIIGFEGRSFILNESHGAFYIHYLLQKSRQKIHASTLVSAYRKFEATRSAGKQQKARAEITSGRMSSSPSSNSGNLLDPEGRDKVHQEYNSLLEERAKAEMRNEDDSVVTIKEEIRQLGEHVLAATRPDGQPQVIDSRMKKDRDAVCNAIERTLEMIEKKSQPLFRHLDKALERSVVCSYVPDRDIVWAL